MFKNHATIGCVVWVKDFSPTRTTFSSEGLKACYLCAVPNGILYCTLEKSYTKGVPFRLGPPSCSNNFKIQHEQWFFPPGKRVEATPEELFGVLPEQPLALRKRGRPPKDKGDKRSLEQANVSWVSLCSGSLRPEPLPENSFVPLQGGVEASMTKVGSNNRIIASKASAAVHVVESVGQSRALGARSGEFLNEHAAFHDDGTPITLNQMFTPAWEKERVTTFDASCSFEYDTLVPECVLLVQCQETGESVIIEVYCVIYGLKNGEFRSHPTLWKKVKAKVRAIVHREYNLLTGESSNGRLPGTVLRTVSVTSGAAQVVQIYVGMGSNMLALKADVTGAYPTAYSGGMKRFAKPPPGFISKKCEEDPKVKQLVEAWVNKGYPVECLVCSAPKANYGSEPAGFYYGAKEHALKAQCLWLEFRQGFYVFARDADKELCAMAAPETWIFRNKWSRKEWGMKFDMPTDVQVVYLLLDRNYRVQFYTEWQSGQTTLELPPSDGSIWQRARARVILGAKGNVIEACVMTTMNAPKAKEGTAWLAIHSPDENSEAKDQILGLTQPKGVACGASTISQYVDDDTAFLAPEDVPGFLRLTHSRAAPITVDDLAEGAEVLGVFWMRHSWTEQELGLDLTGGAMSNNFAYKPGSPENVGHMKYFRKWVDHFADMGVPVVRIFAGKKLPPNQSDDQIIDNVVTNLETACEYAEKRGVILGIENHDFVKNLDYLLHILQAVKTDWLGVIWDSANLAPTPDPYKDLARIAPYAVTAQVKVMTKVNGKNVPADYAKLVEILRDRPEGARRRDHGGRPRSGRSRDRPHRRGDPR